MTVKQMDDLFVDALKDIYYAEKHILKALPKMAKAVRSSELREAFKAHEEETRGHVQRLEEVFSLVGKKASGKKCQAIEGLVAEGEELMREVKADDVLDAGLLAGAQAVEHYEIARYGTLRAWAKQIGLDDAVPLIDQTLKEEQAADKKLTEVAERHINTLAAK